ncbi:ATP-dependent DNA helicase [Candidatus Micrarchaeota archaeon]|nr:ATP-dependent DNA helicase [Candidatus Micrarchaeota archaeon]
MEDIYQATTNQQNFMAQASTGMGKTDASLSAALTCAIENDLDVFFLTPKISQHKIALDVVNGIASKYSLTDLRAVDMVGRSQCCIDDTLSELDSDSFHHSCSKKRKDGHCTYYGNAKGYNKFDEAKANSRFRVVMEQYGVAKTHHELIQMGRSSACCPYEWLLKIAEQSRLVIADYHHILIPHIRDVFLTKIKKRIEDSIIIIDEAHNLAARVRSSLSSNVGSLTFKRMEKEMRFVGLDSGPVEEEFGRWSNELLAGRSECTLSTTAFHEFLGRFGLEPKKVVEDLEKAGTEFIDRTDKRSACLKISKFIEEWGNTQFECIRILKKRGPFFVLSKRMLDPSPATNILNQAHSSVLMSGTLLPLEMHRDVLGLSKEKTVMKEYPNPFAAENVVNIISDNLTTKYSRRDPEEYGQIASQLDSIVSITPGGTAIFFPSYRVLSDIIPLMKSKKLNIQRSGMKSGELKALIKDFKTDGKTEGSGGVLCAVQGGSLSEGVDFAEGEIKSAVIVGVALDEMNVETRALIEYYDKKFSRGWDYGYLYPGTIKALQAAGRGRRKESDRVAIVYLDERFKWHKYNWILNRNEKIVVSKNPHQEVEKFWK